jgi:hypothetical protein
LMDPIIQYWHDGFTTFLGQLAPVAAIVQDNIWLTGQDAVRLAQHTTRINGLREWLRPVKIHVDAAIDALLIFGKRLSTRSRGTAVGKVKAVQRIGRIGPTIFLEIRNDRWSLATCRVELIFRPARRAARLCRSSRTTAFHSSIHNTTAIVCLRSRISTQTGKEIHPLILVSKLFGYALTPVRFHANVRLIERRTRGTTMLVQVRARLTKVAKAWRECFVFQKVRQAQVLIACERITDKRDVLRGEASFGFHGRIAL